MRNRARERDWTEGSIAGNLWALSWPLMVGHSLNMVGPTIDMIWVGRLSSEAIAGVGVAGIVVMMVNSIMMGLGMGARAIIARFIGGSDEDGANHAARQSFFVCALFTFILVPIGIFLAEPIMELFGVEPEVIVQGAPYMRIMLAGSVFMTFRMMTEGIMQASGDSVTPMRIAVFFRVIHVIICPFLIFGWWIFPEMGVSGAAATNVISQGIGLVLGFWVLLSGRTRMKLSLKNYRIDFTMIKRIIKIGVPVALGGMQRTFGNMVLMWFVSPFGTVAVAAHTLCQRVEMFVMMPGLGLGTGAGVLGGQNLGAGKPERAQKSAWVAIGIVQACMLLFSVAILIWAEEIIGIFGADADVVEMTAMFLRITVVAFVVFGLEPVLQSFLSGTGDTIPPTVATMASFWVLIVPFAWLLSEHTGLGVYGIRWARVIGMITTAIVLLVYFRMGRWKRKRVV